MTTTLNVKSVPYWGRSQKRLVTFATGLLALVTPPLLLQYALSSPANGEVLLVWFAGLVVFILADLLAGPIENRLWAEYIHLSLVVTWMIVGLAPALMLLLVGALVAALLRQQNHRQRTWLLIPPVASVRNLALARMTMAGSALFAASALYALLAGAQPPLTTESIQPVPLAAALLGSVGMSFLMGQYLTASLAKEARENWIAGWFLNEVLLLSVAVGLVLIYDQVGLIVFLVVMALVAAQAYRHHQAVYRQNVLLRRVQELTLLSGVGKNIASTLVLDEVLQNVHHWVGELTDVAQFYIGLYDQQRHVVSFPLVMQDGEPLNRPVQLVGEDAFLHRIIQTRTVLYVDRQTDGQYSAVFGNLPDSPRYQMALGVPLQSGQKLVGVMTIITNRESTILSGVELQTLEIIAQQASLAIRNATLYNRSTILADNLTQVNQFMQEVIANMEGEAALEMAAQAAQRITGAQRVAIFQDEDGTAVLKHATGLTQAQLDLYETPVHRPNIYYGQPRIVSNIADLPERDALVELAQAGEFSALAEIPLKSGSAMAGLLIVFHDQPHYHHTTELELLETLAYQLTAALDYTELLGALELYASEQAQLVYLSRTTTASLELEEMIVRVIAMLREMLRADRVSIMLLTADRLCFQAYDGAQSGRLGVDELPEIGDVVRGMGHAPRVLYHEHDLSPAMLKLMDTHGDEMVILMPLIVNQAVLGTILIGKREAHHLSDSERRLLEMATNQVSAQIHNAQLYRGTQEALDRRLNQLSLIEKIAQQISRTLDLDDIIYQVLEAAITATQAETAALGLLTENGQMRVITHEQLDGSHARSEITRSADQGLMGRVLRQGKTLVLPDNGALAAYLPLPAYHHEYQSSLVVPLNSESGALGVLNVESTRPDFFDPERIEFINNLAGHAVISIQNARLLEERQGQIETLTRLRALSIAISSDINLESVTQAILEAALNILPAHLAAIYHYRPASEHFELLAARAEDGVIYQKDTIGVDLDPILHQVLHEEALQFAELHQDSRWNPAGAIAVPVKRSGYIEEVICVALPLQQIYAPTHQNTLELLSIQAAGHLENARLYAQIQSEGNRTRAILDSTRDGIILLDRNGDLVEANVSAENILNIPLDDYIGERFVDTLMNNLEAYDDGMREALTDMARVLRLEPQRITSRSMEIRSGGNNRYVEEVGSPVMDREGKIMGRLLTLRDVTEARLLSNYRDEISSMVVHDLRGPLGSIISSLTLSTEIVESDEIDDPEHRETVTSLIDVSLESANHLLGLVDSILDIAKLEQREMPLTRQVVHVDYLINSAVVTLQSSAKEAGIIVEVDIPEDLPSVEVDEEKIRRVIINLLNNAIAYTPSQGRILVSAALGGRRKIVVRVADSGPGIPPEEADRVFEKFRQIKSNRPVHGGKGSGLGLTFCKLTLEAHDETIWIEQDSPLPGACFTFTLPITQTDS